ncbi:MAG: DUF4040 domain-containing protein, partial [Comamonas sp.]|nr:DUF4040 domain-containing protein [Comamonas sp.]
VGLTTLLLGGLAAMFQRDIKGVLAYSTISHLGLITLLLGLNSALAAVAAVFHVMNHATFKASLFMAAGIVDHESGTRDMQQLSGLRHMMPITATLAMVAAAAMAGVPLLNGFLSKEMFFAETVFLDASPAMRTLLPIAATIAGMFSVAYSLRLIASVFFGPAARDLPRTPHEPTRWMRVPVELLVAICLVVGIFPQWSIGPALAAAARPVVGDVLPVYSLSVWHGLTAPLAMSVIATLMGIAIYGFFLRKDAGMAVKVRTASLNGSWWFDRLTIAITRGARAGRRYAGTRRLQWQMRWIVLAALAAAALPLCSTAAHLGERGSQPPSAVFIILWLTGALCALAAASQAKYHRLAALMLLGGTGLCTTLTFLWFSAPDLALTQLAVEFATTILMLLGLRWLPQRIEDLRDARAEALRTRARRASDGIIACLSGLGMAWLAYALMSRDFLSGASTFFLENAGPLGGGANVVNVMLVDFRGFDTFGEIVVLGIVATTIYALLRRFRPAREAMDLPPQQRALPADLQTDLLNPRDASDTAIGYLMVPAVLARLLLPFTALVAIHLFLRGHDDAGGGFVAGLVFSLALIVQYLISGTVWVESHVRVLPERWMAIGLLLALLTGLGSLLVGYPFLTSHVAHFQLPWLGEIDVASALFFDAGVALLVIGATLLILTAIAHQSVRSHRHHAHLLAAREDNLGQGAA